MKAPPLKTTVDGSETDQSLVNAWRSTFNGILGDFASVAADNLRREREVEAERNAAKQPMDWKTPLMFIGVGLTVAFLAKKFLR